MADDELKLRITPEVDEDALKRAQAEIDAISGKVNLGGKGKGSGVDSALKAELASIRANIDANDLKLRKFVANSLEEENLIRKKQALNQLTAQQANTLLAQESQARENMVSETVAGYQLVEKQLASLDQANQQVINRQKQLFYAQERAQSGFSSMSRSMGTLTSSTKDANIAFANFGRIVQDAPFGLLGISNNIDPLLNSFAQLKASAGGTALALRSMGAVLLGPAGLIFLLGSVLPTALLFAQRAMSNMKKETEEATEEVDTFAQAIKSAADSQTNSLISSLSYTDQVKVLDNALRSVKNRIMEQTLATEDQVKLAEVYFAMQVKAGEMTQEEADRSIALRKRDLGITIEQDKAIRDSIQTKLEVAKANLLVEQSAQALGVVKPRTEAEIQKELDEQRRINAQRIEERKQFEISFSQLVEDENTSRIRSEVSAIEELIASESASAEERIRLNTYLSQTISRLVSEPIKEAIANHKKLVEQITSMQDDVVVDDSDFDRAVKAEERLGQMRIDMLRMSGQEELAITEEGERRKRDAKMELLKLGITDKKAIDQELAMIDAETQTAIKANDKTVAQARADEMLVYADAVSAGLGAIFGENKDVQSAQVVIDTIAGANKAFAGLMPNFPLAVAAAASVTAQGISALRKINSSTKKSKTLSGSGSAGASVASATQRPFVTDAISPSGANIAGRIGAMNNQPQFNVTATVDRMGLALAVRDGESDISTRQIPFAS
jgi:hypothetical protein